MPTSEEVFISYSHDSVDHIQHVLQLSNRLRSEGIDCVIDQYEVSPLEGWPRWMDKKIRHAKYVLLICTEPYFKRVMGEEDQGKGLGVRWEGNLIYQHFYNAGTINQKFIPVVFDESHKRHIPVPMQGATYYCLASEEGYEGLYRSLTGQPKVQKPELGNRRALPEKPVKTNPSMFISSPIDLDLWNKAKWSATAFVFQKGRPPALGLAYRDETAARKIFEGWHERYGDHDADEELRISIIEGDIEGEEPGYTVHISSDPEVVTKRYEKAGFPVDGSIFMTWSRINRMNPSPDSKNLEVFKQLYRQYKTYFLLPAVISKDAKSMKPLFDLGIYKGKLHFRNVSEIGRNDLDSIVLRTGDIERPKTSFHKS